LEWLKSGKKHLACLQKSQKRGGKAESKKGKQLSPGLRASSCKSLPMEAQGTLKPGTPITKGKKRGKKKKKKKKNEKRKQRGVSVH